MNISRIIAFLHPDAEFVLEGNDLKGLDWRGPGTKPTLAKLTAAEPDMLAAQAADAARPSVEARMTALEARLDRAAATQVEGDAASLRDAMKGTP